MTLIKIMFALILISNLVMVYEMCTAMEELESRCDDFLGSIGG